MKNKKQGIIFAIVFSLLVIGGILLYNELSQPAMPEVTLSQVRPMPIPKAQGRGEPIECLIPQYAQDYEQDPLLSEVVLHFRRWEWNVVYSTLDTLVAENPDYLDAYRLQAEAYLINQDYEAALSQLDQILRREPQDVHALGVTAILMRILRDTAGEQERLAALEYVSSEAAKSVRYLLDRTEILLNADYGSKQQTELVPDVIAVFGQTPKANGTPSSGMLSRLEKALELAEQYPSAKLILSGGDLKTEFTEASVMRNWLLEQGVEDNRILMDELARDTYGNAIGILTEMEKIDAHKVVVVGTIFHLPRATTTLTLYAEHVGYPLQIDSAGGGQTEVRDAAEVQYTYVNAARAFGLFTKSDYANFLHE